uniref:Transmembrane protein n=1 Tax=Globodera rostochiensis TaxID=31243 RepID=A0A914HKC9_GLORO
MARDEADHSNGGNALRQHQRENALRQHQRRRRKRMQSFDVIMSDATRRFSTQNSAAEPTCCGAKCITLFVITACTVGSAIFLGLRLSDAGNNHTLIIAMLVILIVAFLFELVMLLWLCVPEHE